MDNELCRTIVRRASPSARKSRKIKKEKKHSFNFCRFCHIDQYSHRLQNTPVRYLLDKDVKTTERKGSLELHSHRPDGSIIDVLEQRKVDPRIVCVGCISRHFLVANNPTLLICQNYYFFFYFHLKKRMY